MKKVEPFSIDQLKQIRRAFIEEANVYIRRADEGAHLGIDYINACMQVSSDAYDLAEKAGEMIKQMEVQK